VSKPIQENDLTKSNDNLNKDNKISLNLSKNTKETLILNPKDSPEKKKPMKTQSF